MKHLAILLVLLMVVVIAGETIVLEKFQGEFSPFMEGRSDLPIYQTGLRELTNMVLQTQGGAVKRPGTYYINDVNGVVESVTYGDYTEYFVGTFFEKPYTYKIVANATDESTIDTTWGEDGFWGYDIDGAKGTVGIKDILQLEDERLLVSFNGYYTDGVYYCGAMLNTDGTLDTDWGTAGFLVTPYAWGITAINDILEDSDGNFHCFTGGEPYRYVKLDSDGAYVSHLRKDYILGCIRAVWTDSTKTRILACGSYMAVRGSWSGWIYPNVMALDPATGDRDLTWTGNLDVAGYANYGGATAYYGIVVLSDDGFVIQKNSTTNSLTKVIADGSALDSDWGTNGTLNIGSIPYAATIPRMTQDGDTLYTLTYEVIDDLGYNTIHKVDSTGTVIAQNEILTESNQTYHLIQAFNDKLILGTNSTAPANFNVEFWSQDLEYESGFDIAGLDAVYFILIDETTREIGSTTYYDVEDIAYRLIPYTHKTDESYVVELGVGYMQFYKEAD